MHDRVPPQELPYCFIAGSEGCPNWGPRLQGLQGVFTRSYNRANPDMQVEKSYEPDAPGEGNLAICSNQVAARFDCLSTTLEMPYKDCKTNPDPERGWSPARCKALGASLLDAIAASRPYLRCGFAHARPTTRIRCRLFRSRAGSGRVYQGQPWR